MDEAHQPLLCFCAEQDSGQPRPLTLAEMDRLVAHTAPIADAGRGGGDAASIFYTGGTTGRAKGVIMTHVNHVVNGLALWAGLGIDTSRARFLHVNAWPESISNMALTRMIMARKKPLR